MYRRVGKGKHLLSLPGSEPRIAQPVAWVPLGRSVNLASNYNVPSYSNLDNKECDSLKSHTPVQQGP